VPTGDEMQRFDAKRQSQTVAVLLCVALVHGCGQDEEQIASACKDGSVAVRKALRDAPAAVRLGGAPLSDCLSEEADGGELQLVGTSFVEAAAALAPSARRRPEGRAALELGYLMGAARRGGSTTQGVHSELLRRMEQELAGVDTRAASFRRGERAGRTGG
jgi:hypothetical protein